MAHTVMKAEKSHIFKLESQNSWCCSSSPSRKAWEPKEMMLPSLSPKAQEWEALMWQEKMDVSVQIEGTN